MLQPKFKDCIRVVKLRLGQIEFYKNSCFFIDDSGRWTEVCYHDLADIVWDNTDDSDIYQEEDEEPTKQDEFSAAKSYLEERSGIHED